MSKQRGEKHLLKVYDKLKKLENYIHKDESYSPFGENSKQVLYPRKVVYGVEDAVEALKNELGILH